MNSFQRFLLPLALLTAALPACWAQNPVVVLETSKGTIEIEFYAEASMRRLVGVKGKAKREDRPGFHAHS
jgi:hypothetical protein